MKRATRNGVREVRIKSKQFFDEYRQWPEVGMVIPGKFVYDSQEGESFTVSAVVDRDRYLYRCAAFLRNTEQPRKRKRAHRENKGHQAAARVVLQNKVDAWENNSPVINERLCGIDCSECTMRRDAQACASYQEFLEEEALTRMAYGPRDYKIEAGY